MFVKFSFLIIYCELYIGMDNEDRIENKNMESGDRNPSKKDSLLVAGNIC